MLPPRDLCLLTGVLYSVHEAFDLIDANGTLLTGLEETRFDLCALKGLSPPVFFNDEGHDVFHYLIGCKSLPAS